MNWKNRKVHEFRMRVNQKEKEMIKFLADEYNLRSQSELVRTLIRKEYDRIQLGKYQK